MNYEEEAGKICATLRSIREMAEGGYEDRRSFMGTIASALRESAAQALAAEAQHWEDILRPGQEVSGSEIKARLWMVADQAKAAAIRAGERSP